MKSLLHPIVNELILLVDDEPSIVKLARMYHEPVAHLRKKLEKSSVKIETVTGVGYKLVTVS